MQFETSYSKKASHTFAIVALSIGLTFGALPLAAQNQPQDQQGGNTAQAQPLPGYPQDNGQNQAAGSGQQDQAPPPPDQAGPPPSNRYPNIRSPYNRQQTPAPAAPASLTIPASEIISVRPTQFISSEKAKVGETFIGTLDQPVIANGWVVARAGQQVIGRVNAVSKSGHFGHKSQLGLELTALNLVDGQQATIQTAGIKNVGGSTTGTDVAAVGATTGVGAAIGAAADGGAGAGIGAGAGAAASLIGVLVSPGRPTIVGPETLLSFQLATPVNVDTTRGQLAFRPVEQSDYRGDQDAYGRGGRRPYGNYYNNYNSETAPPPPNYGYPYDPYYLGYPYPYYGWGYYPGPVIGLGFGWGGGWGYRGGFRGGFRR
jgi:hypothetical protein